MADKISLYRRGNSTRFAYFLHLWQMSELQFLWWIFISTENNLVALLFLFLKPITLLQNVSKNTAAKDLLDFILRITHFVVCFVVLTPGSISVWTQVTLSSLSTSSWQLVILSACVCVCVCVCVISLYGWGYFCVCWYGIWVLWVFFFDA